MAIADNPRMTPRMLGQPIKRREDPKLITGGGRFLDDMTLPGMLYLAMVYSPYGHAKVNGIDTSAAEAAPGVVAVVTAKDLEGATTGPLPYEFSWAPFEDVHDPKRYPLATDKVRYVGDPLAAVLAESRYAARDAAALVEVDYDPLPAVVDPEQALEPGAPLLFEEFGTNLGHTQTKEAGDVEGAFAQADKVVRLKVVNQRVIPAPMETRGALAEWRPGRPGDPGELTLWETTQNAHALRRQVAGLFGLAENKVRVIAPDMGGGFGNRTDVAPETVIACIMAMRLNRPIKWSESRGESMQASMHGRGQTDIIEAAVTDDGRVLGLKVTAICDIGAYNQYLSPIMGMLTGMMLPGTYDVDNVRFELKGVYTNKTPVGAYRGAGRPEATYLLECLMDRIALELGLDPAEVRRINFIAKDKFPYTTCFGTSYDTGDYELALSRALELAGYEQLRREQAEKRARGEIMGIGLSAYVEICGFGPWEHGTVRVEASGKISAYTGISPHGQGNATSLAQIIADELGVDIDDIVVHHGDTATTPTGNGTGGSRGAVQGGSAILMAADTVRDKAIRIAAHLLEASADDVEVIRGGFGVKGAPERTVTLAQVAGAAYGGNVPVGDEPGLESTRFFKADGETFPFGVHIAVVDVDKETGRVTLRRFIAVDDVGNVINPLILDGQRHGGIAQGAAQALCEEVVYDENGQLITGTFGDYAMPTAHILPNFELDRTVTTSPRNPLGVKGVGEAGTIGSTPAVRNAVLDALAQYGIKDFDMPATSLKVWQALHPAPSR
ncbi:MAG: xanthine dehydrogenase family protein molybdopterin-binding subunit [Chloroflexota bacterium]|nr:xanthine dehydrogenase family protein molybdopterin-binding subunit [Chloroflexota bacterium]